MCILYLQLWKDTIRSQSSKSPGLSVACRLLVAHAAPAAATLLLTARTLVPSKLNLGSAVNREWHK